MAGREAWVIEVYTEAGTLEEVRDLLEEQERLAATFGAGNVTARKVRKRKDYVRPENADG